MSPLQITEQITSILADAYQAAALGSVDMRSAAEALETIRSAILSEPDRLGAWDKIDAQVGLAVTTRLEPILAQVRNRYIDNLILSEIESLSDAFRNDPTLGWQLWLLAFTDGVVAGRYVFASRLCEGSFLFPKDSKLQPSELQRLLHFTMEGRWAESYDLYLQLGDCETIPDDWRAQMLATASSICLFHFFQRAAANDLLERAETLSPESVRVVSMRGSYWLQEDSMELARSCFEQAVKLKPGMPDGYTGLGECMERAGDLPGAEQQYRMAIAKAGAYTPGYSSLLRLIGQSALFETHRDEIDLLVKCISAVEPAEEYDACIDAGTAYQYNHLHTEAHQWNQRAIAFNPRRLLAYTSEGYLYLEAEEFDLSEKYFQLAINAAPEAMDGYWGMCALSQDREDWDSVIHWSEESLSRRPQWTAIILMKIGAIQRTMGRGAQAEEAYLGALRFEPDNRDALAGAFGAADDWLKKYNEPEAARRVYTRMREICGESFEPGYINGIATVLFYCARYQDAEDQYRKAIALDSTNGLYHCNLSVALEMLRTPGRRLEELAKARDAMRDAVDFAIEGDRESYRLRLAELERQVRFVTMYGELAMQYVPAVEGVSVLINPQLWPHLLGEQQTELSADILRMLDSMRERVREQFGVFTPTVRFNALDESIAQPGEYRILVMEQPEDAGLTLAGRKFVNAPAEELSRLDIKGKPPHKQGTTLEGLWLAKSRWRMAEAAGLVLWSEEEYIVRHLELVMHRNLAAFIDLQQAVNLLATAGLNSCKSVLTSVDKTVVLTTVLKRLFSRIGSITALDAICTQFEVLYDSGLNPEDIADQLFVQLGASDRSARMQTA